MAGTALLVGSSYSAAPLFFALKQRGLKVWVVGNASDDPCHQYADRSFFVDYSSRDTLLELVKSNPVDYLVPSCNDYSYMSAAWVAQEFGFPGYDSYETALSIHTKMAFREVATRHGIPVPKVWRVGAAGGFDMPVLPVLVKPNDSFSGRGMTKVVDVKELPAALDEARRSSRTGEALVEEFVEGTLHSHSAFISGGNYAFDTFVDEFCTVYPYQVDCSNHPSRLTSVVRDGVRSAILKLATLLGLVDGLIHTQFIANGENFRIIEPMRRGPGDLYGRLVELSTGVPYHDLMVRPYLGEGLSFARPQGVAEPYSRHTISTAAPAVVHSFSQNIPASAVTIVPLMSSAAALKPAPYGKFAILFARHRDEVEMLAVTHKWADHIALHSFEQF